VREIAVEKTNPSQSTSFPCYRVKSGAIPLLREAPVVDAVFSISLSQLNWQEAGQTFPCRGKYALQRVEVILTGTVAIAST
jgi:hypothetical protein